MKFEIERGGPTPTPKDMYEQNPDQVLPAVAYELGRQQNVQGEAFPDWFENTTMLLRALTQAQADPNMRAAFAALGKQMVDANTGEFPQPPELPINSFDPGKFRGSAKAKEQTDDRTTR